MIMAPMAEIPAFPKAVAVVVLSWNGKDDTLQCLASLAGVDYEPLEVIVVDNGSSDGSPEAVEAEFPEAVVIRMGGTPASPAASTRASRRRSGAARLRCCSSTTTWWSSRASSSPLVAAALEPGVAAACSQILFAESPDRVWYAGATFRPRRGHHGRNIGFGEPPLAASALPIRSTAPAAAPCSCRAPRIDEIGLFDEELFAYREDLDWSLPRRPCRPAGGRRAGEHRPPPGLGLDRRRVVADVAVLRHAQRPRRLGALRAARARRHLAPPRRVGPGAPGAGRDVPSTHRGDAGGDRGLARCTAPAPRPSRDVGSRR